MTRGQFIAIVFTLILDQKWDVLQRFFDLLEGLVEADGVALEKIYEVAGTIRSKIDATTTNGE